LTNPIFFEEIDSFIDRNLTPTLSEAERGELTVSPYFQFGEGALTSPLRLGEGLGVRFQFLVFSFAITPSL